MLPRIPLQRSNECKFHYTPVTSHLAAKNYGRTVALCTLGSMLLAACGGGGSSGDISSSGGGTSSSVSSSSSSSSSSLSSSSNSSSSSSSSSTSSSATSVGAELINERALAQTGLAIALASTVLQSQIEILIGANHGIVNCQMLVGGGSVQSGSAATAVNVYYDNNCMQPYVIADANLTTTTLANGDTQVTIAESAMYFGLGGSTIGTLALNETAINSNNTSLQVYGLGIFTPVAGVRTPVQLGLECTIPLNNTSLVSVPCAGGIAQNFPTLGIAIGAVTPLTLTSGTSTSDPISFTGSGAAVTGPIDSLTLTNPQPTSLIIQGGTSYSSTAASGSAATFTLFPPTPTAWTLTDSANNEQLQISVIDNTTRNLNMSIIALSSGTSLAAAALDRSGSGTINYSDGSTAVVTNWTLAD